jgi:methyl-accepting chemotaxis protein
MMRIPISVKISSVIAVSVAITAAVLAYISHVSINEGLDLLANQNVKTSINIAKYEVEELKKGYLQLVETQAVRPNIVKGIVENDEKLLKDLGDTLINTKASDIAVFTDAKGNVIVRSHNDKKGDNIANQDGIKKAIQGYPVVTFESGNVVKFGVRAYAPVKKDGKVVGCIVVGQDLTKDFSFVDGLKNKTGAEYTIFYGKERITTTLEVNGSRAIGTTLDNADITNAVLNAGKDFFGNNVLFGKLHKTAYVPLLSDDKIVGILFAGLNQDAVIRQANTMVNNLSLIHISEPTRRS